MRESMRLKTKMTGEYVAKIQAEVKTSEKLSDVFAQIGGEGLDE